jgi:hypothetical protein
MDPESPSALTEEEPLDNSESYERRLGHIEKIR